MPDGRVLIAFDDTRLEETPTWTRIDNTDNLVAGIDVSFGRQTEFDKTDTGTAIVYLNDTDGLFDPNNVSSPYFGKLDNKQILIQIRNPVTATWVPRWRGSIDDISAIVNPATDVDGNLLIANVQMDCVDLFDYLAKTQMLPGTFGTTPPAGSEGNVWYAEADFQTRVEELLVDAGLPASWYVVFTGNVDVQEVPYDPGDSVLVAIRDALDAEFPGVANGYVDRTGRVAAHGRLARFDPDGTAAGATAGAWLFSRWKVGDGKAIQADPGNVVQVRPPFQWRRSSSRLFNAAIAWPRGILETNISGQIVTDATSITENGYSAHPPMTDLLVAAGTTTGNTPDEETKLYAQHYVENYKTLSTRVEQVTVKAMDWSDARAEKVWEFLTEHDVADVIELTVGYPGGTGFVDEEFYIEGGQIAIRPLNPSFDYVEATVNISPSATFVVNVFD